MEQYNRSFNLAAPSNPRWFSFTKIHSRKGLFISSSVPYSWPIERRSGADAGLPQPAPDRGRPHHQVDAQPAHERIRRE